MKILYVTTVSNTINAFLIPHIKLLVELGHDVDVACNIVSTPNPKLFELGCKVHNVEFQRSPLNKDNFMAYKKIKKIVLSEDYGFIHVHSPIASFITRFACRNIPNLTVLYTAHGFHFYKGAPLKSWMLYYPMERLASRWTDGLITMNIEDYASAKKMILRKKDSVYYIHGIGMDINKFIPRKADEKIKLREKYGYHKNDFIMFYAAELSYRKHQDLLIDVTELLKHKISNILLLLAGDGNLADLYKEQVKRKGLEENVIFMGYRKDISNLLNISDVAVSSSRQEGLPVNIMEAMAMGLALVVTDCRGNHDLVHNNKNGYVVGVNDAEDFFKAIDQLYQSKALRHRFGENSYAMIDEYTLENVLLEMKEIYTTYLV